MKTKGPKKIVAEIVETSEYCKLVELLSSKEILEIVRVLSEKINKKKKSFLLDSGLKPHLNPSTISLKVPQNVQAAKDKFDRELNEQMPLFIQLMNLIPTEDLIPESIAV